MIGTKIKAVESRTMAKILRTTESGDPYLRGYRAGKHGQKMNVNPFKSEGDNQQLWQMGWHEGRREFLG